MSKDYDTNVSVIKCKKLLILILMKQLMNYFAVFPSSNLNEEAFEKYFQILHVFPTL